MRRHTLTGPTPEDTVPLPTYFPQQLSRTADHFLVRPDDRDPFLLDPPYQRGSVWTDTQRVNLVRSLMMGLPIGSIWTNDRGPAVDEYAVIDGRQRIETLRAWFDSRVAVPADWFEPRWLADPDTAPDTPVTHDDLSDIGRRVCRNWRVSELQVDGLDEPAEADLYLLVNFGGVPQDDTDRARATTVAKDTT